MKQIYLRTKRQLETGHGGYAIGYQVLKDNPDGTVDIALSFAHCSDKDPFVKFRARQILSGRMAKGLENGVDVPGKFCRTLLLSKTHSDQSFAEQLKDIYAA